MTYPEKQNYIGAMVSHRTDSESIIIENENLNFSEIKIISD